MHAYASPTKVVPPLLQPDCRIRLLLHHYIDRQELLRKGSRADWVASDCQLSNYGPIRSAKTNCIDCHDCKFTGVGLQQLAKLRNLKRQYIYDCDHVRNEDVLELQKKMMGEFELE